MLFLTMSSAVRLCALLSSVHWPTAVEDLDVGGISPVELLILYERWAGEGLGAGKAVPKFRRVGRPISDTAVPVGPCIDIWRSCRFLGSVLRALRFLLGGLGRFLPGKIGANHCRLRALAWSSVAAASHLGPSRLLTLGFSAIRPCTQSTPPVLARRPPPARRGCVPVVYHFPRNSPRGTCLLESMSLRCLGPGFLMLGSLMSSQLKAIRPWWGERALDSPRKLHLANLFVSERGAVHP